MTPMEQLQANLREADYPFFNEQQLADLLAYVDGDVERASYRGLLIKAEVDEITLPNLTLGSNRAYWLSLARLYRPACGGCVKRGDAV